ncbi:MAG: hypothetical protein ABIA75_03350 [Candidatus Neomarinimicrobiota bacterium]
MVVVATIVTTCEWPFDTELTDSDSLFNLTVKHSIRRVFEEQYIHLSWEGITIENFKEFRIEKQRARDTAWVSVVRLFSPAATSYTDTIIDDDDLEYRIGIVDQDSNVRWAYKKTAIPNTSAVFVPAEFDSIQFAVSSLLMDDGDTVLVSQGSYIQRVRILDKNIFMVAIFGPDSTRITASPSSDIAVYMNSGIIVGFTVAHSGCGLYLTGSGSARNCVILRNGGSLGMYLYRPTGEIINNTIVFNGVTLDGNCDSLLFLNNIIYAYADLALKFSSPGPLDTSRIDYNVINNSIGVGAHNFYENPRFVNARGDNLHLAPTSPCINTGHPGEEYRNRDGTRNTMGAYGGPYAINY